jgi:hypothetical protein
MVVYVQFLDHNANVIPGSRRSDTIVLDTEPPAGSVTIASASSAAGRGPDAPVRALQITATDNLSGSGMQMRLANRADFAGAVWQPFARSATWDFTGGGTVYAHFRDGAGNLSQVYSQLLPGAGAPGASPAPSCTPRPAIQVSPQASNGALTVTLATSGENNGLRAVRFNSFTNAVVDAT